eukprot:Skav215709  [mRNA]  locus=scaffold2573:348464:358925:- [translate_table: standard]
MPEVWASAFTERRRFSRGLFRCQVLLAIVLAAWRFSAFAAPNVGEKVVQASEGALLQRGEAGLGRGDKVVVKVKSAGQKKLLLELVPGPELLMF